MSVTLDALCKKKKKDKEGTSYNTDDASNASLYQCAACYFLALLSFLRMKGNSKKDLQHAREGESEAGVGKSAARDRLYCLWEVNDGAA